MANNARLAEVMADIEADPDSHDQEAFFKRRECGTTLCFAGKAAVLAGIGLPPPGAIDWWVTTDLRSQGYADSWGHRGSGTVHVSEFARDHLGLTHDQSRVLFFSAETIGQLRVLVDAIKVDPHVSGRDLRILINRPHDDDDEADEEAW